MSSNRDNTRTVTIVSKYEGLSVTVKDEKVKGSRLWARASGLDIYLSGTAKGTAHDRITNMACNIALGMNIPLISLHYVKGSKK